MGRSSGERCLYVTLSETQREIGKVARSHGWDLDAIHIKESIARSAASPPMPS